MAEKQYKDTYYRITMVLRIPKETVKGLNWDCGCDETFGLASITTKGIFNKLQGEMTQYETITKEQYNKEKHTIFDKNGGI